MGKRGLCWSSGSEKQGQALGLKGGIHARGLKGNRLFPLRHSLPAPTSPLFMAESDQILCICFIYLITVLNESFSKKIQNKKIQLLTL